MLTKVLNEKYRIKGSSGFLIMLGTVAFLCMFSAPASAEKSSPMDWPAQTKETRPWTYWWWMGNAVDEPNLTENLEAYRGAGIGGVHIVPIYGVKGYEDRFIDYLSPKWMKMLAHTVAEADRLDMGVDMTTGSGWNFGGPLVDIKDACAFINLRPFKLNAGDRLSEKLSKGSLEAVMAYSDKGEVINLTDKVDPAGVLDWVAPKGKWQVYALWQEQEFSCSWRDYKRPRMLKRASPGEEGYMVNPFSSRAMKNYLSRFDKAFTGYKGGMPRSQYNDSYEYWGDWTDELLGEFQSRRGYDLRNHLPAFYGKGSEEIVSRVRCDYRETISDLLLDNHIKQWVDWCHKRGFLTRTQAHGSPGNLLDLYAASDIPETEIFGPSFFKIPGLRSYSGPFPYTSKMDPLMIKFATSAGHVAGKKLMSSESCTWLGAHFKIALSQCKPEIDQLLVSGINHVFYHGIAYSPFSDPWPGWLFYASTSFAPSNTFWRDFPEMNAYIARCQSFLQSGKPDNDILLYFPMHDMWHNWRGERAATGPFKMDKLLYGFGVHAIDRWLYGTEFHKTAKALWERGHTFDYVSDRQLGNTEASPDGIRTGDVKYRVVVVPQCRFMPLATLERLVDMAKGGATVIFQDNLPRDVPGLGNLAKRRELFKKVMAVIKPVDSGQLQIRRASIGKGQFLIGKNLEQMLAMNSVVREEIVDTVGVEFIRRSWERGHHYFMTNLGKNFLDGWVQLGVKAESAVIFDPLFSKRGLASVRQGENGMAQVYLQLEPGQTRILRTFSTDKIEGAKWRYLRQQTYLDLHDAPYEITGNWQVSFIDGGPKLPKGFETTALASWTELGGDDAKVFEGTAKYAITFDLPQGEVDDWVLDLGRVCESARVRINGRNVGTLWSLPFRVAVGRFLRKGKNTLEVEVTNLAANRIADMDRRGVYWKKFYNANFSRIGGGKFDASEWLPMDSGLFGPVHLVASELINPNGR